MRNDIVSDKHDAQHTLKTLRYKRFAKAGYITNDGRKKIINLAIAMQQREWFEGLWGRSKSFDLPVRFTPIFFSLKSSNGKSGIIVLFENPSKNENCFCGRVGRSGHRSGNIRCIQKSDHAKKNWKSASNRSMIEFEEKMSGK